MLRTALPASVGFFRSQRFTLLSQFLALALLPALTIGYFGYQQAVSGLETQAKTNQQLLAQINAERIQTWRLDR